MNRQELLLSAAIELEHKIVQVIKDLLVDAQRQLLAAGIPAIVKDRPDGPPAPHPTPPMLIGKEVEDKFRFLIWFKYVRSPKETTYLGILEIERNRTREVVMEAPEDPYKINCDQFSRETKAASKVPPEELLGASKRPLCINTNLAPLIHEVIRLCGVKAKVN